MMFKGSLFITKDQRRRSRIERWYRLGMTLRQGPRPSGDTLKGRGSDTSNLGFCMGEDLNQPDREE